MRTQSKGKDVTDVMTSHIDARIVKTKSKLISVFKKLLCEKSFEDITVNEICEAADVRRATFYKHYADKYAFLAYYVESLRYEFDMSFTHPECRKNSAEYYTQYLSAIIDFLEKNEKMVKNVLESEMLAVLVNVVMKKNYEVTLERLSAEQGTCLAASAKTVASMMTGAVSGAILNWLKNGKDTPRDVFISEVSAVISAIMRGEK